MVSAVRNNLALHVQNRQGLNERNILVLGEFRQTCGKFDLRCLNLRWIAGHQVIETEREHTGNIQQGLGAYAPLAVFHVRQKAGADIGLPAKLFLGPPQFKPPRLDSFADRVHGFKIIFNSCPNGDQTQVKYFAKLWVDILYGEDILH